jgi:transposase-like protein
MDPDTPRIRRLRHLLATAPRSGAGNRYPDELRAEVVAAVHEARGNGASLTGLAMALGLPSTTLSRWIPTAAPQPRGLVRIDVVSTTPAAMAAPSVPIVELSSGLRVRGLSLEDIVALHRRLS